MTEGSGVVTGPLERSLSVLVGTARGEVIVQVSDNGPGIPDDECELLTGERDCTQLEHTSGLGL
ncbi:hypothetical protein ACYJ1Y_10670 [Natrialbaceae archaeon A-gly3]